MAQARTGLLRRKGKCAGKPRRINKIRLELVFRGPEQECSHNAHQISALASELVFRDVPGKLVQRNRHSQRFRRRVCLRRALLDPVGGGVVRVPVAPTRLGLPPARGLAFQLAAGMLPVSHSFIRPEPPAADRAGSLPGLWHGDASSSPRFASVRLEFRSDCLGHFWQA